MDAEVGVPDGYLIILQEGSRCLITVYKDRDIRFHSVVIDNTRNMKTFILLAVCFVAAQALTDEQKVKLNKHKSECLVEAKPDEQLVNKLKLGDFKVENEPLKKYVLCMLIKSELMTKEGKFKKDVALAKVPNPADKPAVEKLIDLCLANKGNSPQQAAWNYAKCYHEKDPNHSIFQ